MEPAELEAAQQEYDEVQARSEKRALDIAERASNIMSRMTVDDLIECLNECSASDRNNLWAAWEEGDFSAIGAVFHDAVENYSRRVATHQIDSEE